MIELGGIDLPAPEFEGLGDARRGGDGRAMPGIGGLAGEEETPGGDGSGKGRWAEAVLDGETGPLHLRLVVEGEFLVGQHPIVIDAEGRVAHVAGETADGDGALGIVERELELPDFLLHEGAPPFLLGDGDEIGQREVKVIADAQEPGDDLAPLLLGGCAVEFDPGLGDREDAVFPQLAADTEFAEGGETEGGRRGGRGLFAGSLHVWFLQWLLRPFC